jgi:hypothetical protein
MASDPPTGGRPARSRSRWMRGVAFLGSHPTRRSGLNWTIWALVLIAVAALADGTTRPSSSNVTAGETPISTASAATPGTDVPGPAVSPSLMSTAAKTTPTPVPVQATGGVVVTRAGAVLPDPARTPGATNPAVTQSDIHSTICVSGWTATVRPSSSYTTTLKEQQLAGGYAYRGDTLAEDYEEDHLISLELGGSPDSELNLWPEPYIATDGARTKDLVENKLHSLVCSGAVSLATAQHAIATNWFTAYLSYVGVATPAPTTTRIHTPAGSGTS